MWYVIAPLFMQFFFSGISGHCSRERHRIGQKAGLSLVNFDAHLTHSPMRKSDGLFNSNNVAQTYYQQPADAVIN